MAGDLAAHHVVVRATGNGPTPLGVLAGLAPLLLLGLLYREIDQPLLAYVRALRADGADVVTVVIGELVLRWWHHALHNHRALESKAALVFEPGVAVAAVPHHLEDPGRNTSCPLSPLSSPALSS